MSAPAYKVHLDAEGRTRCGKTGRPLTADETAVTCLTCIGLMNGTHNVGVHPYDVKPCGSPAAYRRHLRQQGKPVRCEECLRAEARRTGDRKRDLRRAA